MDAVVVDSRLRAGRALFGCLVTSERGGKMQRPGTGSSREVWVGLGFCLVFLPRDLDLHPLVFPGVHPPCNVEMKSTLSWSWSL